ncbi:MAG: hypothetical protein FJ087_16275, partial [Deltaproteobacteria bacterium]|nr:hypothetical protein [Deltaproteobacteria bacterium]
GGPGGHGGGGGGGCGGPAYGLFASGADPASLAQYKAASLAFTGNGTGGDPGLGGQSYGKPGANGAAGVAGQFNF